MDKTRKTSKHSEPQLGRANLAQSKIAKGERAFRKKRSRNARMRRRTSLVRRKPHADRRSRAAFAHAPPRKQDRQTRPRVQKKNAVGTQGFDAASRPRRHNLREAILDRGDIGQAQWGSHVPGTSPIACARHFVLGMRAAKFREHFVRA